MWQTQAERTWPAGVLANEKAVASLLRFLKRSVVEGERRSKGERIKMGAEKRPSR